MSFAEGFWWALTMAAVVWYSTVTVYVAVRGAFDIRSMLKRLDDQHRTENGDST
ncbi:MAG: hypothetical protein WD648_08660 [Planctomycetaceae bacterium]